MQFPEAFANRMKIQLGQNFTVFQNAIYGAVPISIRVNPRKVTIPYQGNQKVLWEPMAFYLNERPVFTLDPQLHAGAYYVQEASSMFIGYLFNHLYEKSAPLKILDLCAAPGGKSTQIASVMNELSFLVSNEVIKSRAAILTENIVKWGNPNVIVTQNDPSDFQRLPNLFDLVIVDAPCSGEGLFRRDESAMNEWSAENAQLCALRQQRILIDAWETLAPGGYLIYSTCTYNPDENEKNLALIAQKFDAESISIPIPDEWGISRIKFQQVEAYQFFPHKLEGEGFFVGVLQKKGEAQPLKHKIKKKFTTPGKELLQTATNWLVQPEYFKLIELNNTLRAIPNPMQAYIELISETLRIVNSGILMAEIKGNKLVPQHDLALSWFVNKNQFPQIELNDYESLLYLKKENIHFGNVSRGYNLVLNRNLPLGYLNNIGNRSNNNYPMNWRIRMELPLKENFTPQVVLQNHEI